MCCRLLCSLQVFSNEGRICKQFKYCRFLSNSFLFEFDLFRQPLPDHQWTDFHLLPSFQCSLIVFLLTNYCSHTNSFEFKIDNLRILISAECIAGALARACVIFFYHFFAFFFPLSTRKLSDSFVLMFSHFGIVLCWIGYGCFWFVYFYFSIGIRSKICCVLFFFSIFSLMRAYEWKRNRNQLTAASTSKMERMLRKEVVLIVVSI